jgi:NADH-quinone oxidoreductase subunit L
VTQEAILSLLAMTVAVAPVVLLVVLGTAVLWGRSLSEKSIANFTESSVLAGLAASLVILAWMLASGSRYVELELGNWVLLPGDHFHCRLKFVFDRLSVPFVVLTYTLVGTIGAFASRYLHRDPGYRRFFLLYAFFLVGMVLASLAGTIETLFLGWELVGLSSALLVAYFQERRSPVVNGLRVWGVYRLADAAFLIAAVVLHHSSGGGDFEALMGTGPWPEGQAQISPGNALVIGILLLAAAAGKSALLPFCGWLPRAMEGPTPSSAVFYGALSVHLGAFLLLRVSPLLDASFLLSVVVATVGVGTALFASLAARVQTDVKSGLAFASLTQVGIITAEIGCGFRYLALVHILGHACLRTLQLLRAPSLLRDYRELENAIGGRLGRTFPLDEEEVESSVSRRWYGLAYRRGMLDDWMDAWVTGTFLRFFRRCNRLEERWTRFLGKRSSEPHSGYPLPVAPNQDAEARS